MCFCPMIFIKWLDVLDGSGGPNADAVVHDTGGVKGRAAGLEVGRVLGADAPAAWQGVVGGALHEVAPFAGATSARGAAHDELEGGSGVESRQPCGAARRKRIAK
jgi:hypothetical protein